MPNLQQQISDIKKYCNSLTDYSRFKTREVTIGNVKMGGDNPIVIQSMTTTDTMDTMATVEQSIRMIEAGCELVRITAPSKKEAENLRNIKAELVKRGYNTPIVADIHFTPNAAEIAARIVEKVRVNPGNYADKKKFDIIEYSDAQYQEELNRILPVVRAIHKVLPDAILSVDTVRSSVAIACLEAGAHIINDISGASIDSELIDVIAKYKVPYILMHMKGNPDTMQSEAKYSDVTMEVLAFMSNQIRALRARGIYRWRTYNFLTSLILSLP